MNLKIIIFWLAASLVALADSAPVNHPELGRITRNTTNAEIERIVHEAFQYKSIDLARECYLSLNSSPLLLQRLETERPSDFKSQVALMIIREPTDYDKDTRSEIEWLRLQQGSHGAPVGLIMALEILKESIPKEYFNNDKIDIAKLRNSYQERVLLAGKIENSLKSREEIRSTEEHSPSSNSFHEPKQTSGNPPTQTTATSLSEVRSPWLYVLGGAAALALIVWVLRLRRK